MKNTQFVLTIPNGNLKMEMCLWLVKQITLRNCFTSICSIVTLLLICHTFVNIKPTSMSKEELELGGADISETVFCANPGFSWL